MAFEEESERDFHLINHRSTSSVFYLHVPLSQKQWMMAYDGNLCNVHDK
jgi:hypothetical protein